MTLPCSPQRRSSGPCVRLARVRTELCLLPNVRCACQGGSHHVDRRSAVYQIQVPDAANQALGR